MGASLEQAEREIGILVYPATFLAEDAELRRMLADKAKSGVRVRILPGDPDSRAVAERGQGEGIDEAITGKVRNAIILFRPLLKIDNIEIRLHGTTLYNSIYRGDEQLLVSTHIFDDGARVMSGQAAQRRGSMLNVAEVAGAVFKAVAAPAGDSTFVTAVAQGNACTSQLYQFQLNRRGQPGPLMPLHITVPGNYSEFGDLAVTPDGRTIAYATYLCDGAGEVGVINLATGHVGVWTTSGPLQPAGLSLSADGSRLSYDTLPGGQDPEHQRPRWPAPRAQPDRIPYRGLGRAGRRRRLARCISAPSRPATSRRPAAAP
jgi:hypothetical protein